MNLKAEVLNDSQSRQVIYQWKEEYTDCTQKHTLANNMQIILMNINEMAKFEYLIIPKGTKLQGPGKLGLKHTRGD